MFDKDYLLAILKISYGIPLTIKYSFFSAIFGLILGSIICAGRYSKLKLISNFCKLYISIVRGVPLLLQLSIIYFTLPALLGRDISAFTSGLIAFSINSSAYIAEIIRSGLQSIDSGQFEAADSLNLTKIQKYRDIILPQVIRNILPALLNEFISLIKESAILSVIGELDITKRANLVASQYYVYFGPLIFAGFLYYMIVLLLTVISHKIEKKLNK